MKVLDPYEYVSYRAIRDLRLYGKGSISFRRPSEKDNFHNLIFVLTKDTFDVFSVLIKLSLSKGGDGWRKAFKNLTYNLEYSF